MKKILSLNRFILFSRQIVCESRISVIVAMILLLNVNVFQLSAQRSHVTIKERTLTVLQVLKEIEQQTDYLFVYNKNEVDVNRKISIKADQTPIAEVLNRLFASTNTTFVIEGGNILLRTKSSAVPAATNKKKITGAVLDSNGDALIGANVSVKGTTTGTITDMDGKFTLDASQGETLLVSYIGYTPNEKPITALSNYTITLSEDSKTIDEVVVIGYGTVRKSDLTGSVTSIKEKDFNVGLIGSPTQLIQGRVSGVNITNNGGEPGGGVSVRVRGSNSIRAGQDPLYVVDGVPLDVSDAQPSGANIAGVGSIGKKNPLNFLNPDDIESIDILKDASATAIYGARGANGVIIVTTKKGKEGVAKVSYSGYMSVSDLPSRYNVLSASEFKAFGTQRGLNLEDGGAEVDYQKEIFRSSFSHNHNLSMTGGTASNSYRVSLGYQDQQGIVKRTGMERYTGRFNMSQKALNNRLVIDAGLTVTRTNDQRAPLGESGGFEGDLLLTALKINPTYPIYNPDGTYFQKSKDMRNPVAMINLTNDNTQTDRILANITGTLTIWDELKYKMNVALDQTKASRKVTQDKELSYLTDKGTVDINNIEGGNFLIENYLTYNITPASGHRFDFLLGHSYQKFRTYNFGLSETGFTVDDVDYLYDLAFGKNTQITGRSNIVVNELQSFFGRVNYSLMDKYMLTVNLRSDGSTKFGANNKYGFFPSAALAWRMNQEAFLKDVTAVSNLKLRLSWGVTGNQEIPNKISQMMLGSTSGAIFDGSGTVVPGVTLTRTPNPDLKWERTEQLNLGVDFGLFQGRLSGTLDLFSKNTKDVLLEAYSVAPAPTTKMWSNVPNMRIVNQGIELGLNGVIITNKNWNWSVGANFTTIRNEVKDLPMSYITTANPSGPGITGFNAQVIKSGYPIGTFWGYKFLGFDEKGKSLYETDEDGKPLEQDLGCALPKFTYNFNTALSWKSFDLSLFFSGVAGNKVYNNLGNVIDNLSMISKGYNTTTDAIKSPEAFDNVLDYSNRFIEDGSYLRLSNATFAYNVPLKDKRWISNLRFSLTGNNLFVISNYKGYDPEVNAGRSSNGVPALGIGWTSYPMARSFTFGVACDF